MLQGVPHSSVPRRNKPRRVDLYYSSWCIRAGNKYFQFLLLDLSLLVLHGKRRGSHVYVVAIPAKIPKAYYYGLSQATFMQITLFNIKITLCPLSFKPIVSY